MISSWHQLVVDNFNKAAHTYDSEAKLQRAIAWRLAKYCSKQKIYPGIWVDLGAGTGLLAEALETCNPEQSVIRLDKSSEMLSQKNQDSNSQLWDLNTGLPNWSELPTLLASSFALHWLSDPTIRLQEWFQALAPGGWLAIAIPVEGCFPQWHLAASKANVSCTAMSFPSRDSLIKALKPDQLRYEQLFRFTQKASEVSSLLKPIIKTGAHSHLKPALSIGEWRRLNKKWPRSNKNDEVKLTWLIEMLLFQK